MTATVISLIAWAPFLLLAIMFCLIFSFKGYKRGAAMAGISIGATVISCIISILVSKLIASAIAGNFAPIITNALKNSGVKAGASELASLGVSLGSALASLVLFVPVFILFASIIKPVLASVFKKIIPTAKNVGNKIGGLSIAIVDALLLVILVTLPLYGTLALTDDVVSLFGDKDSKSIKMITAATDPFVVDVASVPPFSTVYDSLMTCKIGSTSVSLSGTVREATDLIRNAKAVGGFKSGNFSKKNTLALLNSAEKLMTKNEFVTDFLCEYMADKIPSFKVPGIGKVELDEYYPALSDSKQLRSDLPAIFDLTESMVKSGMVGALVNKDTDMSKVNAETVSKAFSKTLNHSSSLATLKSNLLNVISDSLLQEMIDDGKDKNGSIQALRDALNSIPADPMTGNDARSEGESFYLIMSGVITASREKTQAMGLGMMLEGMARHPMIGTETVVGAMGSIIENSGIKLSDALLDKLEENLAESLNRPVSENFFGKYCQVAFTTIEAFGGIAGNNGDSSESGKNSTTEGLKELITSDKDALNAVKDTVSSDLMADIGIDDKHADSFKDIIDATFDAIIESDCTEKEAEKEAEALGNVLGTITDLTNNPEDTDDIVKSTTVDLIEECLDSKVATNTILRLTDGGRTDPLGFFTDLSDEAKASVEETIDEYIANAKTADEIALFEAFKLFVGIKND